MAPSIFVALALDGSFSHFTSGEMAPSTHSTGDCVSPKYDTDTGNKKNLLLQPGIKH
jgi:hypothetical protein